MWMWARDPSWHPAPRARDKKSRIIFFPLARPTVLLARLPVLASCGVIREKYYFLLLTWNLWHILSIAALSAAGRLDLIFQIIRRTMVLIDFDHIVASIAGTPPPLFLSSYQLENLWKINLTWLGLSLVLHLRYLTPCWVAELLLLQSALFWLKRIEAQLLFWEENPQGKWFRRKFVNLGRSW